MTSERFYELFNNTNQYTHVEQKNDDIGGGVTTFEEIDQINNFEDFESVLISGLRQDTFEYFVSTQAYKFTNILFFKNKFVKDLSSLATLKKVEFIGYYHNQRATNLWDMSGNEKLEGVYSSDFTRLKLLDGVTNAPAIERLHYGDAIWSTSKIDNVFALEGSNIKEFSFSGSSIINDDINVYTKMPKLEELDFPLNYFTTEQIAWLVAMLPNVKGYCLKPYVKFDDCEPGEKDIKICGKRKPSLSSEKSSKKLKSMLKNLMS